MMTGKAEVARLRSRLDATFQRIKHISSDLEVQGDFAKYLCILVANYIENSIAILLTDYVRRNASPSVVRYVERRLDRFTNAKVARIKELVGAFNPDWQRELEVVIVDEREAAINSVIAIRHQVAHGESASISYARIKEYYEDADKVVGAIAKMCE